MHAIIVDEELPYPPTSGKPLRILNLLVHLAQRHQITFIAHRRTESRIDDEAVSTLEAKDIECVLVDRTIPVADREQGGIRFYSRLAVNLFAGVPYSVQWNKCENLKQAVRDFLSRNRVDLLQCEWAPYATAIWDIKNVPWVMMAHDVQSIIWQRFRDTEDNWLKRQYIELQRKKYLNFEQQVFSRATLTITVTEKDAQRAKAMFAARCTAVVENGVDVSCYQDEALRRSVGRRRASEVLFLGNLKWRPNLDAVKLLLDEIFPHVLKSEPAARLCVVGPNRRSG